MRRKMAWPGLTSFGFVPAQGGETIKTRAAIRRAEFGWRIPIPLWYRRNVLQETVAIIYAAQPEVPRVGLNSKQDLARKRAETAMLSSESFPFFDINAGPCPVAEYLAEKKTPGSPAGKRGERKSEPDKRSAPANRILLLGRIQELAMYRAEVLQARGFEVRTSTDKAEAVKLLRSAGYDAVVMSYTLSSDTVEELTEEMREHCPHCPLVVIARTQQPDRKIAPDAIALADDGPKALIAALRRVLQRH